MKYFGISEGDLIFVLGYPMGIVDNDRQYVISKSGSIARIRNLLDNYRGMFLIDALIFPGNSGSPVILRPENTCVEGTQNIPNCALLGVVNSYIPYTDVACSLQTKIPRVVFQENSGLAAVIPIDYVMKIINDNFGLNNPYIEIYFE